MNHYDILGLEITCDQSKIKPAYRKKASENHPDIPGGNTEKMKQINAAYEVLSNPSKRKAYDEFLILQNIKNNTALRETLHTAAKMVSVDVPVFLALNGGTAQYEGNSYVIPPYCQINTIIQSRCGTKFLKVGDIKNEKNFSKKGNNLYYNVPVVSVYDLIGGFEITHPNGAKVSVSAPDYYVCGGGDLTYVGHGWRGKDGKMGDFVIHIESIVIPQLSKEDKKSLQAVCKKHSIFKRNS